MSSKASAISDGKGIGLLKQQQLGEIIQVLEELKGDSTVPRNVKTKIEDSVSTLKDEASEISIRIDKVIQTMDEISNDPNTQSYTRSQIYNLVSMLESIQS